MKEIKRETVVSVIIVCVLLVVGVLISGLINKKHMDYKERLNKAIKTDSEEIFQYSLDTNVGDIIVYGELKALNPVSYPGLEKSYLDILRVKEKYTMHVNTYTDSKGNVTTTVDWTWDTVDEEYKISENVKFAGVNFSSSKFNLQKGSHIKTIRISSDIRYQYYANEISNMGTIFTNISENDIDNTVFQKGVDIDTFVTKKSRNIVLYLFWFGWLVIILVVVGNYLNY